MAYINEAFDTNWIAPLDRIVNNFETDLVRYTGCGHVAALSSGTAASSSCNYSSEVGPGDEGSTFLYILATVNPVVYQHAIPVFVDSEKKTWNMDLRLEKTIKDKDKGEE